MKTINTRRQFLTNTSLALLAIPIGLRGRTTGLEMQNSDCAPTTLDFFGEGPFYTEGPPEIVDGLLAKQEEEGVRLVVTGRVYNLDCSEFIPNTLIDVWHASDAGDYDNEGFNLRGTTLSNEQGYYQFETIKPGRYRNGSQFRPPHIHFRITPPDQETLITQLYFQGDEEIATDPAASKDEGDFDATSRIIPIEMNDDGKYEGTWDIRIIGDGLTSNNDLHVDKGMIYSVGPNPIVNDVIIHYGVFKRSKVSLFVHDILGRQVALLEERTLSAEKYEAIWSPGAEISPGTYFISLKVNDQQVHYVKVVR